MCGSTSGMPPGYVAVCVCEIRPTLTADMFFVAFVQVEPWMKVMEAGLRDGVVMIIRDEVEFAIAQVRPQGADNHNAPMHQSLAHTHCCILFILFVCQPRERKRKQEMAAKRAADPKHKAKRRFGGRTRRTQPFPQHENELHIGQAPPSAASDSGAAAAGPAWACAACTFENPGSARACQMCGTPKP